MGHDCLKTYVGSSRRINKLREWLLVQPNTGRRAPPAAVEAERLARWRGLVRMLSCSEIETVTVYTL